MFAPFGDARHKIAGGDVSQSRDMYFGIYQALATASEDVFRQYRSDFFDLIVIDECHRGSSRDESAWRAVLDYFQPAVQFGMTATPLREESRDSYEYFGNPVYTYSLRQGIEDGFLAPYRVHRVITTVDAAGWRPSKDELDRYGRAVPDEEYQTNDFERVVALRSRTRAMAKHLTEFLKGTDRFAKTIVFCVDQEHAAEMRQELLNLNSDLIKQYPDYVCRVTADEAAIGLTHLAHFQDVDSGTRLSVQVTRKLPDADEILTVLAARFVEEASADALTQNRTELASLGQGARLEVAEFTKIVAQAHPTISPDFLATAVKAVINLEKSKSGAALLHKLSSLPAEDIVGLDQLLTEWSIKDALRVLDEIDSRISVIETIHRLADDPHTDELHTLHPLILRSRWLFGAEFESQEYCSNVTLQTVARELFKKTEAQFINEKNRPDIVVLPDKTTCQITGLEAFDPADPTLTQLQHILLIELKKGGFELTRKEINQADDYVQDIAASGALSGAPYICAWVVGQKVAKGVVGTDKKLSDANREYGRVRATTFGTLVDTANRRLLKLRDILASRYGSLSTDDLLDRVFSRPEQIRIDL